MEKYGGCVECFVPQRWCGQWQEKSEEDQRQGGYQRIAGKGCQYKDIVLGGFAVAMAEEGGFGRQVLQRLQEAGYQADSNEENIRYLGRRIEWGGLEANRLLWEFWQAARSE